MLHRFGDFELDEQRFELRRRGKPVPLQRKVLETIIYLVTNRDRLISKDELFAGPWKDTTVTDAALTRGIMLAREALSDRAGRNQLIQTVRGKGYRFVAEVSTERGGPLKSSSPPGAPGRTTDSIPPTQGTFFGRQNELRVLSNAMAAAIAGRGAIVLVGGEPGVGKTTFLQTVARNTTTGTEALWGRCWEGEGAPAFWPWLEILRECVERYGDRAVSMMGSGASDIAQLLPELRATLRDASPSPSVADLESPQARFRLFDAIARFLHRAARSFPLALFIDDLHAADDASILLLQFLSRAIESSPLLVVASYRDLEVSSHPTLSSFLGGPINGSFRIPLVGLGEDDVGALLASRLDRPVLADLARRAREVTDGNPFLVSELSAALRAGERNGIIDSSAVDTFRMPNRVVELVRRHFARLPASTVDALSTASVVGRDFTAALLSEIQGIDPEHCANDLEPAILDGFIRISTRRPGAFTFSHSLLRETVYQLLPSAGRVDFHFRAAEALERREQRHAFDDSADFQIARHYYAAGTHKGTEKALHWALRVAKRATGMFAYELAMEHYERALELLEGAGREKEICETLLLLGDTQRLAGQAGPAMATFGRVESMARERRDGESLARALIGCVDVLRDGSALQGTLAQRLEESLGILGDEDSALRARVLAAIPIAGFLQPSMADRLGHYYELAVAMATRLSDHGTLATVLHTCHWRMMSDGTPPERALIAADELMKVARQAKHSDKILDGHMWRAHNLATLGRAKDFAAEADEHSVLARRIRHPLHLWFADLGLSGRARISGNWVEADALARKAFIAGVPLQGPIAKALFVAQLLGSGIEKDGEPRRDNMREAAELIHEILTQLPPLPIFLAVVAFVDVEATSLGVARASFERLVDQDVRMLPPDQNLLPVLTLLARLAASLEDRPRAKAMYGYLRPYLGRHVAIMSLADYWGPVSHYLGCLALTTGELGLARAHFEQATLESRLMNAPIWIAWADCEHGILLRRSSLGSESSRGVALLRTAVAASERLGLAQLHKRASLALAEST